MFDFSVPIFCRQLRPSWCTCGLLMRSLCALSKTFSFFCNVLRRLVSLKMYLVVYSLESSKACKPTHPLPPYLNGCSRSRNLTEHGNRALRSQPSRQDFVIKRQRSLVQGEVRLSNQSSAVGTNLPNLGSRFSWCCRGSYQVLSNTKVINVECLVIGQVEACAIPVRQVPTEVIQWKIYITWNKDDPIYFDFY